MAVNGEDDIDRLAVSSNRSFDRLQDSVNTMQQLTSIMARDKSGHGLGLSLVKAVADMHEAKIVLEDALPGLLVRVTFDSV